MADIEVRVRAFIVENFLFGDGAGLEEETSFLQSGIIDSTGVLELVGFIEEEFDLVVRDEELIPDNLDSIGRVARYLRVKAGKEMLKMPVSASM
ncbi:MAG: acyl carrier protein [Desulfuromonadales bacterium]|jgi:acyl carrier protein